MAEEPFASLTCEQKIKRCPSKITGFLSLALRVLKPQRHLPGRQSGFRSGDHPVTARSRATNGRHCEARSVVAIIPRQSRGLSKCEPLKAVKNGVANAAPTLCATYRWRLPPQPELIEPFIFPLMMPNVVSDQLLVSPYGRDKVASRPEVLTGEVHLSL